MRTIRNLGIATFLSITTLSSAQAYERASGVTVTPMIGYSWYDFNGVKLDDDQHAGLGLGYQTSSPWSFEFAWQSGDSSVNGLDSDLDVEQFRLDVLYDLMHNRAFNPYIVFGAGQLQVNGDDINNIKNDMTDLGLGLKYNFNQHLALRGDIRASYDLNDSHQMYTANLGLQILIGGSSKKAAAVAFIDSDNDGIEDKMDNCPGTAPGTMVDSYGCDKNKDSDGDGVVDAQDQCPGSNAGAKVDDKGCYLVIKEDITSELEVTFANNSAEIVSGREELKKIAGFMRDYPHSKVVIEGYTDSSGAASYNLKLSQKRADAVVNSLVNDYGADATRLTSIGRGEANPVASNATAEGRAANRRVTARAKATVEKTLD